MMGKQEGPGAMLSYPMQQGQRWKLPSSLLMEWYTLSLSLKLTRTWTLSHTPTKYKRGHRAQVRHGADTLMDSLTICFGNLFLTNSDTDAMINCVRARSGTGVTSRIEPKSLFLSDQDKEQKHYCNLENTRKPGN